MKIQCALLCLLFLFCFSGCEKSKTELNTQRDTSPPSSIQNKSTEKDIYAQKPVEDLDQLVERFAKGHFEGNRYLWAKSFGPQSVTIIVKKLDELGPYGDIQKIERLLILLGIVGDDNAVSIFDKTIKAAISTGPEGLSSDNIDSALIGLSYIAAHGGEKALEYLYKSCSYKTWRERLSGSREGVRQDLTNNNTDSALPYTSIYYLGSVGTQNALNMLLKIMKNPNGMHAIKGEKGEKKVIFWILYGLERYAMAKASGLQNRPHMPIERYVETYFSKDYPDAFRRWNILRGIFNHGNEDPIELLWQRLEDKAKEDEWHLVLEAIGWHHNPVDLTRLITFADQNLKGILNSARKKALLQLPITLGYLSSDIQKDSGRSPQKEAFQILLNECGADASNMAKTLTFSENTEKDSFSIKWQKSCAEGFAITGRKKAKKRLRQMAKKAKGDSTLQRAFNDALIAWNIAAKEGAKKAYPFDLWAARESVLKQYSK